MTITTADLMTRVYEATASGRVILATRAYDETHAAARFRLVIDSAPGIAPEGYFVGEPTEDLTRICGGPDAGCIRQCVGCKLASLARIGYDKAGRALAAS